jgi:hypothetical protein
MKKGARGDKPGGKGGAKADYKKNPRLKGPAKTPVVEKSEIQFRKEQIIRL